MKLFPNNLGVALPLTQGGESFLPGKLWASGNGSASTTENLVPESGGTWPDAHLPIV
jgi:hypothetical protein